MTKQRELSIQDDISNLKEENKNTLKEKNKNTEIVLHKGGLIFESMIFRNVAFTFENFSGYSKVKFKDCLFEDCIFEDISSLKINNCLFDECISFYNIEFSKIKNSSFYFVSNKVRENIDIKLCEDISFKNCYVSAVRKEEDPNKKHSAFKCYDTNFISFEKCSIKNFYYVIISDNSELIIKDCTFDNFNIGFKLEFGSKLNIKNLNIGVYEKKIIGKVTSNSEVEWENCPEILFENI